MGDLAGSLSDACLISCAAPGGLRVDTGYAGKFTRQARQLTLG